MQMLQKYRFYILGIILGAIGGYLYYHYVGCVTGTCAISSVWYRMVPYGAFMGFLLGGMLEDWLRPGKKES